MRKRITVEKVLFNIRTQALLNFTPISFIMKHADIKKGELIETPHFSEDAHRSLGANFITYEDKDKNLWEIKIVKFPKEYEKIIQSLEANPHYIPYQFNILDAGMVNVSFHDVLLWAYGKFVMPRKMQERSTYSG